MKLKTNITTVLIGLLGLILFSFKEKNEINSCFISFSKASNLTAAAPDRLPESPAKKWNVKTEKGEVDVTRIDGYRVLYNNNKNVPFVNLKVELSAEGSYETDKKNIVENLKYLNAHSSGMEGKELTELQFNGYKMQGLGRGTIESGSTLGIFVLFPGNGMTVYFYFNNIKPEFRNFDNLEDYKKQRDLFLEEFTLHLKTCIKN